MNNKQKKLYNELVELKDLTQHSDYIEYNNMKLDMELDDLYNQLQLYSSDLKFMEKCMIVYFSIVENLIHSSIIRSHK